MVNSILGFAYDHGTYLAFNAGSDPGETPAGYTEAEWRLIVQHPQDYPDIVDIQKYGDTTYYTVTPKVLPLVRPLYAIPIIGKPIADLIEPALRVIIEETGYNRTIPFGQPAETQLFPIFNPITLVLKLVPAIFQGINNFLANFGLATEIPLSPVPAVSSLVDRQDDELEQAALLNETDESSAVRLALVQDDGEVEPQPVEGDEKTVIVDTETEEELTLSEGDEPLITQGTFEPEEIGLDPVDTVKADLEAADAERKAAREAAKAERKAAREAAKADREAAKAEREAARAEREAARAERDAARDAADSDDDSDSGQAAA